MPRPLTKQSSEMAYAPRQEEAQLVNGCLRGDQQAQKMLFEKYYGKMLGVCQRYCDDREEAKDILQEGFIKIFQKIGQFNFNSPLEAWLRRIIVNTAIDYYRKSMTEPIMQDIEKAYGVSSEHHDVVSDMSHAEMLNCLQQLPTGYRMVFNMYVIEGYSHKEIAESLNITEGTSKSQLAKARVYIQKLLAKNFSSHNG
jgi:RNA polymerase sigma-70 factor (ECF subfamily)